MKRLAHKLEDAIRVWGKNGRRHHPTASTRVDIARIYLLKGRWADAIEACRQATDSDSAWAVPYTLWGDTLLASGDPRGAIERYTVATEKDAHYVQAFAGWGRALAEQGEWPLAIDRFQAARDRQVERDDIAADIYTGLGDGLYAVGQFDAAIWSYNVALNMPSRNEPRCAREPGPGARACAGPRLFSPTVPRPTPRRGSTKSRRLPRVALRSSRPSHPWKLRTPAIAGRGGCISDAGRR